MHSQQTFQQQGFIVLRQFYSHIELAEFRRCIDAVFPSWFEQNRQTIFDQCQVNMHSLTHSDYYVDNSAQRVQFFKAIVAEKLATQLNLMFDDEIYFHNTQLFFNPPNPKRTPYWHRDLQYSPVPDEQQQRAQAEMLSLHVRIPLVPETSLELVPGSHRQWDSDLERDVRFERNGHTQNETLPGSELVALKAGDVLIFDAQMLHRGLYANDAERMALDLCLGHPHPLTNSFLDSAVLPTDDELQQLADPELYLNARKLVDG